MRALGCKFDARAMSKKQVTSHLRVAKRQSSPRLVTPIEMLKCPDPRVVLTNGKNHNQIPVDITAETDPRSWSPITFASASTGLCKRCSSDRADQHHKKNCTIDPRRERLSYKIRKRLLLAPSGTVPELSGPFPLEKLRTTTMKRED
jgi:hypothetical protein